MAGLGIVISGVAGGGLAAGAATSAFANRGEKTPEWDVSKVAVATTVGLVAATVALGFARNVPVLEHNLPLDVIGSLTGLGSFAAAGFTAGSVGANLIERAT